MKALTLVLRVQALRRGQKLLQYWHLPPPLCTRRSPPCLHSQPPAPPAAHQVNTVHVDLTRTGLRQQQGRLTQPLAQRLMTVKGAPCRAPNAPPPAAASHAACLHVQFSLAIGLFSLAEPFVSRGACRKRCSLRPARGRRLGAAGGRSGWRWQI